MELSHPEEYKALRRAAARQDGQIIDPPESLSHSPLCRMEGLVPDGYGGLMHGENARLVITEEGRAMSNGTSARPPGNGGRKSRNP